MSKILFNFSVNVNIKILAKENIMHNLTIHNHKLIKKIDEILNNFKDFERPYVNNDGDIIIKKKVTNKKDKNSSILANIFREIIKNDLKKNRV